MAEGTFDRRTATFNGELDTPCGELVRFKGESVLTETLGEGTWRDGEASQGSRRGDCLSVENSLVVKICEVGLEVFSVRVRTWCRLRCGATGGGGGEEDDNHKLSATLPP